MSCKDCSYFNENDRSGSNCYCSYYRKYYDPDDNCSHCTYGGTNNCADCQYCDKNDTSGSKVYCSYYRQYVYTNDSCSRYSSGSSGGCYLTSACCTHKGLSDDCEYLFVLRSFRDAYMKSLPDGNKMIEEYYEIAPLIVKEIEHSPEKSQTYEEIFKIISDCVSLIRLGDNEGALKQYKSMTLSLKSRFLK